MSTSWASVSSLARLGPSGRQSPFTGDSGDRRTDSPLELPFCPSQSPPGTESPESYRRSGERLAVSELDFYRCWTYCVQLIVLRSPSDRPDRRGPNRAAAPTASSGPIGEAFDW